MRLDIDRMISVRIYGTDCCPYRFGYNNADIYTTTPHIGDYEMNDYNDDKEDNLAKFDTTDKTYSIDKKIDCFTVRSMVIRSLENIVREELNRHIAIINLCKVIDGIQKEDKEDIVIANISNNLSDHQDDDSTKLSTSLLKLKIRNTTAYLNWRIAISKRDNFKCRMCNLQVPKTTRP